jgi:hypothetical protein
MKGLPFLVNALMDSFGFNEVGTIEAENIKSPVTHSR